MLARDLRSADLALDAAAAEAAGDEDPVDPAPNRASAPSSSSSVSESTQSMLTLAPCRKPLWPSASETDL